jgi:thymidine kinase
MAEEIREGEFELYCGPMLSGKTKELLLRLDMLTHRSDAEPLLFKPKTDTRDDTIKSRLINYAPEYIAIDDPAEILMHVNGEHNIIGIDEIMLFPKGSGIKNVIEILLAKNKHVIAAGLDRDFKGEAFGEMKELLVLADHVKKLTAICKYNNCNGRATRTQRLVNGKPASYTAPTTSIEGSVENESYECRCIKHHFVPGKPGHTNTG